MYLPGSYYAALLLMVVSMLCWGSWANTQKMVRGWRFELFYWDYAAAVFIFALIFALSMGAHGEGPSFIDRLHAADWEHIAWAFVSGLTFNIANTLLVAAISMAGMAVAFPIGVGIALVEGTIFSYWVSPQGNFMVIGLGVTLILYAIYCNAMAFQRMARQNVEGGGEKPRGIGLSILCGVIMGVNYPMAAKAMTGAQGIDPYSANLLFCLGLFLCAIPMNIILMRKPVAGKRVYFSDYLRGSFLQHFMGIVGGLIWCTGMVFNLIASNKAGPAVAYAFGQGATLVAAIWGVFIWREFRHAKRVNGLLTVMFLSYILGLAAIGTAH